MENIKNILVVDDIEENRKLIKDVIRKYTNYNPILVEDGTYLIKNFEEIFKEKIDLILLDIMMPEINGYETAQFLKENNRTKDIPIIFITALSDVKNKVDAFEIGGVDYITKPFNKSEMIARINNHISLKNMRDNLEELVNEKTQKIETLTMSIVSALEMANFYNDNDTGKHIKRVSKYSAILAKGYGESLEFIRKIELYASLHDIGKVGVADDILKKNGKFTSEEFEKMKEHVEIGSRILNSTEIDIMAKNIARYHHEKWDGSGYLEGLKEKEIPLEARIVALADVYDALTTKRVYKPAFSQEEAEKIIVEQKGKHFEPKLVELFFKLKPEILKIKEENNE